MQIQLQNLSFQYEPYPIGLARPIFEPDFYHDLVTSWPSLDLFLFKKELGNKYSLSEVNHARQYHNFVRSRKAWSEFHRIIKSSAFVDDVIRTLCQHNIDLSYVRRSPSRFSFNKKKSPWSARWEFSMLPAYSGNILPHTDAPQKIITLVFSMQEPGEWNADWGGGTDVLKPKDVTKTFNYRNVYAQFDEMEVLSSFPFEPNQCVLFVKTFNSWHSVQPMTAPQSETTMRKTVTINIETVSS